MASSRASGSFTVSAGAEVMDTRVFRHPVTGARRLALKLQGPAGGPPVEVRARLMLDGQPLTETWTTRWQP